MLQKLSFLLLLAIFLGGCGAEAPADSDVHHGSLVSGNRETAFIRPAPEETEPASGNQKTAPEYFRFSTGTTTTCSDSGIPILMERYCHAHFTSGDKGRENWVNGVLAGIESNFDEESRNLLNYASKDLEARGSGDFYSYSNYQKLSVLRQDEVVVSLLSDSSLYSGGPHGSALLTAYNLDITNSRNLRLEDVIYEEAAPELGAAVLESVEAQFVPLGEGALYAGYADMIRDACTYGSMTPYWYLDNEGLTVYFNQYALAPYAAGTIRATFLYEELEGILREEFFPVEYDDVPSDLVLRGDWKGYERIPVSTGTGTDTMTVGVMGEIYQVQLSQVQWLDGNAISRELLFCAATLSQNDVLEISGTFNLDTETTCIAFINGEGERKSYQLTEKGIVKTP